MKLLAYGPEREKALIRVESGERACLSHFVKTINESIWAELPLNHRALQVVICIIRCHGFGADVSVKVTEWEFGKRH